MPGATTDDGMMQDRWERARPALGVVAGIVAGALIPQSLQVGLGLYFPESLEWSVLFWGEHWVLRPLASVASAFMAGAVAGAVARRNGHSVATMAVAPAVLVWAIAALTGWLGHLPFTDSSTYVSIGNRLAATVIVFALIPVARVGGQEGAAFGQRYADHFDSRSHTLLGVRWFHYLWLPFLIHLLLIQFAWAGYYGLEWLKVSWRSGADYYTSIIPMLFLLGMWGTLMIAGRGAGTAYRALSGIEGSPTMLGQATAVIKNGVGLPVVAGVLQLAIMAIHYGLASWIR